MRAAASAFASTSPTRCGVADASPDGPRKFFLYGTLNWTRLSCGAALSRAEQPAGERAGLRTSASRSSLRPTRQWRGPRTRDRCHACRQKYSTITSGLRLQHLDRIKASGVFFSV